MPSNKPSESSVNSPISTASVTALVAGGAICGAAIAVVATRRSRGVAERTLSTLEQLTRSNQQDIKHGLDQMTTRFQTSLQSQELVIQRSLQPVAAAQQQLMDINRDVGAIKNIFHAPKSRGNFGEFQLETLIRHAMASPESYDFQYTLSNKKRVDCILHMPSPIGKLAVDSKFPLDSFQQLLEDGGDEEANSEDAKEAAKGKIRASLSKHIHDIASKYIIPGETADYALMFLPSEAIFLQIVEQHLEIILQANRKRVYIACPTTLMALLAQLHGASRGMALQEETDEMVGYVQKLTEDVDRLVQRFDHAEKSLEKTKSELGKMRTSIGKIRRHKAELDAIGGFLTRANNGGTATEKSKPNYPTAKIAQGETSASTTTSGQTILNGEANAQQSDTRMDGREKVSRQ